MRTTYVTHGSFEMRAHPSQFRYDCSHMPSHIGNRLTDNARGADDAQGLIQRAITEVANQTGWIIRDRSVVFTGQYYDRKKVGSFIARVTNDREESAVLKLQLRPLPFDEGFITRHIQPQLKSNRIRLPKLIADEPWNDHRGYGYLLTEDVTHLPKLWAGHSPTDVEMNRHASFLEVFMHDVLPITPFLPTPSHTLQEAYRDAFEHFSEIAQLSVHHHIEPSTVERMRKTYLRILGDLTSGDIHFTHGHLSGMDVIEDRTSDSFILFSNLLWSFRPTYYECIFPLWVDLMGIRDTRVTLQRFQSRITAWATLWQRIQGIDPRKDSFFWFLLLERTMMTVMLDLGAGDWGDTEQDEKEALLRTWVDLFDWLISEQHSTI